MPNKIPSSYELTRKCRKPSNLIMTYFYFTIPNDSMFYINECYNLVIMILFLYALRSLPVTPLFCVSTSVFVSVTQHSYRTNFLALLNCCSKKFYLLLQLQPGQLQMRFTAKDKWFYFTFFHSSGFLNTDAQKNLIP